MMYRDHEPDCAIQTGGDCTCRQPVNDRGTAPLGPDVMDKVEYDGQIWQVSAITEDGYELIGYGDVHNYVDFGDEASMTLIERG